MLEKALLSALDQDYPSLDIIVADNASEAETAQIVQPYLQDARLRYIRNPQNIGMVRNWHKALHELALGEWFLILSDDDYLTDRSYLTKAWKLIEKNPSVVIVYAGGIVSNEETGKATLLQPPFPSIVDGKTIFLSRGTVRPQDFILCNILFKRTAALETRPFENPLNLSCDSELFLKMALHGDIGVIHEPVCVYRLTDGNTLLQVSRKPEFMIHNNDYLINPYLMARSENLLPPRELRSWRRHLIDRSLLSTLLHLNRREPERLSDFFHYLYKKSPRLFFAWLGHYPVKASLLLLRWYFSRNIHFFQRR